MEVDVSAHVDMSVKMITRPSEPTSNVSSRFCLAIDADQSRIVAADAAVEMPARNLLAMLWKCDLVQASMLGALSAASQMKVAAACIAESAAIMKGADSKRSIQ